MAISLFGVLNKDRSKRSQLISNNYVDKLLFLLNPNLDSIYLSDNTVSNSLSGDKLKVFNRATPSLVAINAYGAFSNYNAISGFIVLKMNNLLNTSSDTFMSCRTSGNLGFTWNLSAASGTPPNRSFRNTFVIQGLAAYNSLLDISGYDGKIVVIGISAKSSDTVKFYIDGKLIDTINVGGFTNPGTENILIGAQGPSGIANTYLDAEVFLSGCWVNRVLSDAEHKDIASTYGNTLFSSNNITQFIPAGFPTGPRVHYVVYSVSETRFPQQDDIVKGWPGVAITSGYERINTDTQDLIFSASAIGLTSSTTYRIAYCWYDGINYSDVSTTTFTTTAPASPILSAATLYNVTSTTARPRVTITFS